MRDVFAEIMLTVRVPFEADDAIVETESILKRDRSIMLSHRQGLKRPTKAAIVAAILLDFRKKSNEERLAICRTGIAELNAMIEERPLPSPVGKPSTMMIDGDLELAKKEAEKQAGSKAGATKRKDRRTG